MLTKQQMTKENYIEIMTANAKQYPVFGTLTREQQEFLAIINLASGIAESHFLDGKLVGISGMRYMGLGEIWSACLPEVRDEKKLSLYKTAKRDFIAYCKELNLWRVYAENTMSSNFLEHLGFKEQPETFVWTRNK